MGARQDKIDNDQRGMWASINAMQKALAMAETTSRSFPAGASSDPNINDTIDATILRINTKNMVHHDVLLPRLQTIGDHAGIEQKHYSLKGAQGLSRRFTLVFEGHDKDAAARRAKQFHQSLRGSNSKWEEVTVTKPGGGEEVVFISPDKKYSTIQRELGCKALADVLKEHDKETNFTMVRKEFAITVDWEVFATIEYNHEKKSTHITWGKAAEILGPRAAQIEERYNARMAERKSRG